MLPSSFKWRNHAVVMAHFVPHEHVIEAFPSTKISAIEIGLWRNPSGDSEHAEAQHAVFSMTEETQDKSLRAIVAILTQSQPQIWGWSPSRVEIPFLVNRCSARGIPMGILGQNPSPGRGLTYHREFMDDVWNAMPFYGNMDDMPKCPVSAQSHRRAWLHHFNMTHGEAWSEGLEEATEDFQKLSRALHQIAELTRADLLPLA